MSDREKTKQKLIIDFLKRRGATAHFLKYRWDTVKVDPANTSSFNIIQGFKYLDGPGLYLFGSCGTGKTHVAKAIFNTIAEWKVECLMVNNENVANDTPPIDTSAYKIHWMSMSEYIDSQRGKPDHDVRRHVFNATILFIDDFGVAELTEWAKDQVWMLIDHCYTRGVQLIITSNMDLMSIKQMYGERVSSRINEMCIPLPFGGEDRRLKKQQENFGVVASRINQRKDIEG